MYQLRQTNDHLAHREEPNEQQNSFVLTEHMSVRDDILLHCEADQPSILDICNTVADHSSRTSKLAKDPRCEDLPIATVSLHRQETRSIEQKNAKRGLQPGFLRAGKV